MIIKIEIEFYGYLDKINEVILFFEDNNKKLTFESFIEFIEKYLIQYFLLKNENINQFIQIHEDYLTKNKIDLVKLINYFEGI